MLHFIRIESLFCLLVGMIHGGILSAQDAGSSSVRPGINKAFLDPDLDVQRWLDTFEVESREIFQSRRSIADAMKLGRGDHVADVGSGTGLFLELISRRVGSDGHVYAVDIAPAFVTRAREVAETRDLRNITPVLGGQANVRLAPKSIDVAFLCDVYHHFEYPTASLQSLHRALRSGGSLIVIDFNRIEGITRQWLLDHVRADKQTFKQEIEAAGFQFVGEESIDGLSENYFLRFLKLDDTDEPTQAES
ncbi:MAG: methyltransferase domain-containing protein [Planctomycetota bacterium]